MYFRSIHCSSGFHVQMKRSQVGFGPTTTTSAFPELRPGGGGMCRVGSHPTGPVWWMASPAFQKHRWERHLHEQFSLSFQLSFSQSVLPSLSHTLPLFIPVSCLYFPPLSRSQRHARTQKHTTAKQQHNSGKPPTEIPPLQRNTPCHTSVTMICQPGTVKGPLHTHTHSHM